MQLNKQLLLAGALTVFGVAGGFALDEQPMVFTPPSAGSVDNTPEFPAGEIGNQAGNPYYESLHYSAHVKRTYVPGYIPKKTSLYENPRTRPDIAGMMKTPYEPLPNFPAYHVGSAPERFGAQIGSPALDYWQGKQGITSNLGKGLPEGMRVVEPALVPVESRVEKGGIYIRGGGTNTLMLGAEADYKSAPDTPYYPAPRQSYPETIEK